MGYTRKERDDDRRRATEILNKLDKNRYPYLAEEYQQKSYEVIDYLLERRAHYSSAPIDSILGWMEGDYRSRQPNQT